WDAAPSSNDWNTALNWTPDTIPNGPSDVATFATSNTTAVRVSANSEVSGIVFNPNASAFTITVSPSSSATTQLSISGTGVTNNSGITQLFVAGTNTSSQHGEIVFSNSATAGNSLVTFRNNAAFIA